MRFFRLLTVLLLWICLCGGATVVRAADEDLEYKVKAAFLLNFAKFTTWPASSWNEASCLKLCILGRDPFGLALQGVEAKQVAGKNVVLERAVSPAQTESLCHLVFVSKSEQGQVDRLVKAYSGKPVVTVSDIEGFAAAGGIFELKNKDGRMSFIINNTKAKESNIHISASLLNLAVEVL